MVRTLRTGCALSSAVFALLIASEASAATIRVAAGGDLQAALDAARPGDTILLPQRAVFRGNFVLKARSGSAFITLRTDIAETGAYAPGTRMTAAAAASLARLQSPGTAPALKTAASAQYWRIELLRFGPNDRGYGDIIEIGDGSSAQNTLASVPAHFVLDRLYVAGDPLLGQKRGIALNGIDVSVTNSVIRDMKAVGQDTQALGGYNGPGPFLIENNYIEAAGENFLLGGTDPPIANLVPSHVTFRRNYVSRPVMWRSAIIPPPLSVTASVLTGGSLTAGTYSYVVVARRPAGQTNIATSVPSSRASAKLGAAGSVRVQWAAVSNAAEYRVYRTSSAGTVYWTTANAFFVDAGAKGAAGTPPTAATLWSVKNIFELKNARDVLVEQNVFENNWEAEQAGYAIVLTVRDTGGRCSWCTIQNVEFRYNTVRHVSGAVNILGIDYRPCVPADGINIHDNLFYDVSQARWGGTGVFLLMGEAPRNVTVDHNTVDHDGSTVVSMYGGTPTAPEVIPGFRYTNNLSRHNAYGIFASGMTYGEVSIDAYFPDGVVVRNLLAGGPASRYPGNFVSPSFDSQFVDMNAANYQLLDSSPFRNAGTDGRDLGVNVGMLGGSAGPDDTIVPSGPPPAPRGLRILGGG